MFSNLNKRIFNISYRALRTVAALVVAALITTSHLILSDFILKDNKVYAAFNKQINYQGKLTNSSGVAVANGSYIMKFRLYTTATSATTTNIWEEIRTATGDKATVTNGLFSVMLGSSTPFTGVDFNQTLYLGVEVCGTTGLSGCDNEMSPRKILGAVPAAFVADNVDGISSEEFLRNDAVNSTSTASNFITITQTGAGNVAEFYGTAAGTPAFSILSNGKIGVGSSSPFAQFSASTTNSIAAIFDQRGSSDILQLQKSGFNLFNFTSTGRLGIGSTSPYAALAVAGEAVADIFTSTSTTATSTFANHISIGTGKEFRIGGTGILTRSGSAIIGGDLSGNTRGAGSLDIQGSRNAITQVASGATSTALGNWNTAGGASSTAIGVNNSSAGNLSSAVGYSNSAASLNSVAIGYTNTASNNNASAVGFQNTASAFYSTASGYRNTASGQSSSAHGSSNTSAALNSSTFGRSNFSGTGGLGSVAFGMMNNQTNATINWSTGAIVNTPVAATVVGRLTSAVGIQNTAGGNYSNAFGFYNTIGSNVSSSSAFGVFNTVTATSSSVFGSGITNSIATSTQIGPSDAAKLTILGGTGSVGYVGVGTSTPYARLTVWGAGTGTGLLANFANNASTTVFSALDNGNVGISTSSPFARLSVSGASLGTGIIFAVSTSTASATNTAFVIDANGKVGIGTTSPSSQLAIAGGWFTTSSSTGMNGINLTGGCFAINGTCVGGSSGGSGTVSSGLTGQTAFYNADGTTVSGTSTIFTSTASRVGIGSTTPWAKLSVGSFGGTAPQFVVASSTGSSATSTDFIIDQFGNVGVGTTSPWAKFSVAGQAVADYFTSVSTTATSTFAYDASIIGRLSVLQTSTNATIVGDTTGNARGTNATDVQSGRTAATQVAGGFRNSAFGYGNTTGNNYSVGLGYSNTASAFYATAVGYLNTAAGSSHTAAFGSENIVSGNLSNAFGSENIVTGALSNAFGALNKTYNLNTVVFGKQNYTGDAGTGLGAVAVGLLNNQTGGTLDYTTAAISGTATGTATVGRLSGAIGIKNTSSGNYSQAFGYQNTASAAGASVFGSDITNAIASSTQIGPSNSAKLTILGGTGAVGYVGVATATPYARLTVWGDITGKVFEAVSNASTSLLSVSATGFGTTTVAGLNISAQATSTSNVGINLSGGCFAINGTCVGSGSGGGTVTGTGVANQIAFWSGTSAISGGTDFLFDSSTGRMSLGATTTPFGQLSINTSAGTSSLVIGSSTGTHLIVDKYGFVGIGTTSPWAKLSVAGQAVADYFTGTSNTPSTFPYASTTGISTNGLTINTSVNGPLQANAGVVSATSSIGVLYGGTGATSFAANSLIFYNGTSFTSTSTHPLYVGAINATSTTINSNFNSSVGLSSTTPFAQLSINTSAGTPALTIGSSTGTYFTVDSQGNTGVGTSSPFAKLSVQGVTQTAAGQVPLAFAVYGGTGSGGSTIAGGGALMIMGNGSDTGLQTGGAGGSMNIVGGNGGNSSASIGGVGGSIFISGGYGGSGIPSASQGNVLLAVASSSASAIGKVGVGTSTPYARLTVWGAGTGTGLLANFANNASTTVFSALDNGNVGISTSSPFARLSVSGASLGTGIIFAVSTSTASATNTAFVIDANGKVGIGTTSPSSQLAIAGGWFTTSSSTGMNGINLTGGCFAINGTCVGSGSGGGTVTGTGVANQIAFWSGTSAISGGTDFLFDSSTGRMSLGATTTPFGQLSINTSAGTSSLVIGSSTGTHLIVDKYGFVGIGTTSPWGKLSIAYDDASGLTTGLVVQNNSAATAIMVSSPTSKAATLRFGQNGGRRWGIRKTADAEGGSNTGSNFQIESFTDGDAHYQYPFQIERFSGNVQVGSQASLPFTSALSVWGKGLATDQVFELVDGASTTIAKFLDNGTGYFTGNIGIGTSTPYAKLSVWGAGTGTGLLANFANNASTSVFTLLDNGNLGLGTTSPYARLAVAGQVVADYFTATSTTATSTFAWGIQTNLLNVVSTAASSTIAGGLRITGGGLALTTLPNCNGTSVLETDSAGVVTCGADAGAGAGITGSGVAGQVSFWDSSSSQAGSTDFKFSATTGRMSLGATTTPFGQLSINTSAGTSSLVIGSSTGTHFIVDSLGNVGVGTSTPWAKLSVAGQAVADYFTSVSTTATSTFAYDVKITGALKVGQSNGAVVVGDVTGNVRGTNAVDIQSSRPFGATRVASGVGSLAIGFNNSASGNYSTASGYRNSSSGAASFAVGYQNTASVLYSFALGVNNTASGLKSTASGYRNTTSGNYAATFGSYITNNVSSSTQIGSGDLGKLTILGSTGAEGFTGIASTTPWGKLSVNQLAGEIGFVVGSSTGTNFIVDEFGKVGIGSTSPYAKLSVIGGGNNGMFPSFVVATTSTNTIGQHPLLYVTATTTGALDYARVSIGTTTTPYGINSGLRDQLTVAGRIYQTWRYLSCDVPGASLIGTFNADTIGACGDFGFDEDTVATFTPGTNDALPYARLKGSDTPALTEAGAIRTNTIIGAASSSPVMEVVARQFSGLATSTVTYIGFTNEAHGGNYVQATAHTNAIVFAASSTNNWQAIVRKNGAETRVDTGVASTSSGLPFNRFRIEASSTSVLYLINGAVVASIDSATSNNIPNSNLYFSVSTGIYSTGLVGVDREMDISLIRVWVDDPPTGLPSLAQEESGGIASFDPNNYDAISGAAISTSYLQNSEGTIEEGTILSLGDIPAMLKISETPYDNKLFGVVSGATANITLGEENEHTIRVATAGRVLVKVSPENGNIKSGDYITSSSKSGVAMRATGSGQVIGRALQEYNGTTTGKILISVQPTYYPGNAFVVDSIGNVGVGFGTTTTGIKLDVLGDIGGNGFVAHANRNLMKDIAQLGGNDYQAYLDKIRNININTYRYSTDAAEVPTRLGLLADQAPSEVLSITGDVDVYKLATFTLAGVKAQQLKIDSLDQRLTTLEELVANGGFATTTATSTLPIVSYFESLGTKISQDLASFKNVIIETLTVGSAEKPTGITLYDEITGQPYCLKISYGQPKSEAGKCGSEKPKAPIVTPPTLPAETNGSSTPSTPTEPGTPTEQPVVDSPKVETPPAEAPPPAEVPPPPPADAPTE